MATPRDPKVVLSDMRGAFERPGTSRERIVAVRDAMLTPRERELIAGVPSDTRSDAVFDGLARRVGRILGDAGYFPPDAFWHITHCDVGNAILRECEVEAINRAHENGTF